ncbi:uncharacterized protein LOC120200468 isoform X2 [Hibiscus syriacus]|uniref:uncharacterized protein LOC120200468 isoform X2 n=1 Tax=Hibiscus syriacus TaxID=106335 RepID=UPI001922AE4D|nr:uncharacterized protein LOC120200468 isoform X2 [Hibiscus syriacus]
MSHETGNFRPEPTDAFSSFSASTLCSFVESVGSSPRNVQELANLRNTNDIRFSEEVSENTYESSVSCLSREARPGIHQYNGHEPESRSIVANDSDSSDSEIFRVKRPSFLKAEKRNGNQAMSSKSSEHQGLKRLKKLQHEGRCRQSVPSECCRNDERNHNISRTSDYKEARRGHLPISIKYRKSGNDEAMIRQQEQHRNDRLKHELGKCTREPPPLEMGPIPKRIKVRGPIYVSSERRLD